MLVHLEVLDAKLLDPRLGTQQLAHAKVHAQTGGLRAAVNASLLQWLASDAALSAHLLGLDGAAEDKRETEIF